MSCGLTSGTTSGTFGSIRKALELSTTTAPAAAAIGLHSRETRCAGVLDRTMSTPRERVAADQPRSDTSSPRKVTVLPALRSEARNLIDASGKAAPPAGGSSALPRPHWPRRRRRASRSNSPGSTKHDHPARAGSVLWDQPQHPGSAARSLAEYVTISYDPTVRAGRRDRAWRRPLAAVRSHESLSRMKMEFGSSPTLGRLER